MHRKNETPKVDRCECCGQIIPPKLMFEGKPIPQRIYDYIAAHPEGVTRAEIIDHVYCDDIDGGPECRSVISVHLNRMRPTLKAYGLNISTAWGPGAKYRLMPYLEAAE